MTDEERAEMVEAVARAAATADAEVMPYIAEHTHRAIAEAAVNALAPLIAARERAAAAYAWGAPASWVRAGMPAEFAVRMAEKNALTAALARAKSAHPETDAT